MNHSQEDELEQEIVHVLGNNILDSNRDISVGEAQSEARAMLQSYLDKKILEAFKHGQRVGQYQAADKLYGYVTTIWMLKDGSPEELRMNSERTDDMLKDCEKYLNHNRKAYKEYLKILKSKQSQEKE